MRRFGSQNSSKFKVQSSKSEKLILHPPSFILPLRRSRGYAPFPVRLPFKLPPVLAVGGELKATFCLAKDEFAFMSQHIGDMENLETLRAFEKSVEQMRKLFHIEPEIIAFDKHPNYLSARRAKENAAKLFQPATKIVGVQHHHAHIASVMAENGVSENEKVIGFAFDGTGYGDDGAIWGGEVLLADYHGYEFDLIERGEKFEIDCAPLIRRAALDVLDGISTGEISAKFNNAAANLILRLAVIFRERDKLNKVALSGGCFQNVALLRASLQRLRENDFEVFTHRQVPPNDGGLALGQAVIAGFAPLKN